MSMYFKIRRPHYLALLLLNFVLLLSVVFSLKSIGETGVIAFDSYSSRYQNKAWYVIELGNIPIGTAIVSLDDKKTGLSYDYGLQLASRVGISPITSENFVHIQNANKANPIQKKVVQKSLSKSQSMHSRVELTDEKLMHQNAAAHLSEEQETFLTEKKSFFFNESQTFSFKEVLQPFQKNFLKIADAFDAHYSKDKFLQFASLKLNGNVPIEFKRVDEAKYNEEIKKIFQQRIDLGWLNSLQDSKDEMDNLFKNLSYCQSEMQNLNKSILKQMPHESYLIYRRIINLKQLCSRLETALNASESLDEDESLSIIADHVKNVFKEDVRELAHAISQFPDRTLYYNHAVSFLWPRITTALIQNSVNELLNLYKLDLNRKSLLGIQLKMKKMQPKAIVRADIVQISSPIKFLIQTENDTNMKDSSLKEISGANSDSNPSNSNSKSNSYYLNGIFFASNSNHDLESICKSNSGNIGIDLGDMPQTIVNSVAIRGVWDAQTKLTVARMFGIQATLEKSCNNIYFRTDAVFAKFLQKELDTLKNESLSLESSLLLSNYGQKKLWVMPGKYRISISSIINEKVISVQEFFVGESTQTNVVANVH